MTQLTGPTASFVAASEVLDAIRAAIDGGPTELPRRAGIVPGSIAWDNCEDCGQLALSMGRAYLSSDFPVEDQQSSHANCAAAWLVAGYSVQLIRCAPMPSSAGVPPGMDALSSSASVIQADLTIILEAIETQLCAMVQNDEIIDYTLTQGSIVGPEGACVGSQLDFSVAFHR